ncbi:F-box/LRR-repeat protein 12 [Cornus florida]|uniref:F-box/LRR-repeat protein 12 n=1 Tax=Cornus florida TaxID=4283 RepID=UPI00289A2E93|nr:F-box/LRR-repeat protein 12 [Cornus florida]XP_059626319.1 F-box/LRR-repeat protein 12 [Cornus florida]
MENPSRDGPTSIMYLPDDCLYIIFQKLDSGSDRESFGLTCHRWLHIQNSSRRSLQFLCSFGLLNHPSLSQSSHGNNVFQFYSLLNRFRQLQSLSLSGCMDLPDSALSQLQNYGSKLQSLYLDCCFKITNNGLSSVATGCPLLTSISLYRCNVSDIGLETLANSCLDLKDVNLSYCSLISDHGISALSQKCRQLQAVRISYCRSISGVGFKGCSQALAYLEADSCKLEPEGVSGIVSGGGLEYLNVSSLSWVNGGGLRAIGAGLGTRLKILNFRICRTIGDESIVAIAKGCPLLEEWNLAVCHEVRILGWEAIGFYCCNLARLHVNRCRNLSDRGLQALRDGCRKLSILYISQCHEITSTAMELFKFLRADVEIKEEEVMCIAPVWAFQRFR